MSTSISMKRAWTLGLAGALGVGMLLLSPAAANAAASESTAVAVDITGTLSPLDPVTNAPLFVNDLAQTYGTVAAPPEAVISIPSVVVQVDLGPYIGGLQDVLWFNGLAAQSSSVGTDFTASASVDEFRMNTPGGTLTIQGISASVACSASGATASVGSGMTVDLNGTSVPLDPSGTTVMDLFDPPVPGYHFVLTLIQSSSSTANSATATGLTIQVDEDLSYIIKGDAAFKIAQVSCAFNLADTGTEIPAFVVPGALTLIGLGGTILIVLRTRAGREDGRP